MAESKLTKICPYCGSEFQKNNVIQKFCSANCARPGRYPALPARFWMKVTRGGPLECWLWNGAKNSGGYGVVQIDGGAKTASRVSWGLTFGSIPNGLFVCHSCDTPSCVNPRHLFLGSAKDNSFDMTTKGRGRRGEQSTRSKLNNPKVRFIRESNLSVNELAKQFGLGKATIYRVLSRKTWDHVQ